MGGLFGAVSKRDVVNDVFFGTDYHSHLGTHRGGMASWNEEDGFERDIHNIETSPFRTKFANILNEMRGKSCIGCISDSEPQPVIVKSKIGTFACITVGYIYNSEELINKYLDETKGHFDTLSGSKVNETELVAAMICEKEDFVSGIKYVHDTIKGSCTILLLTEGGALIAARDKFGRLPLNIGVDADGHCVSLESFAMTKLGYEMERELGPGEICKITSDEVVVLAKPGNKKKVCSFMWTYYGYPTAEYEGVNVEISRNRGGEIMAERDGNIGVDTISGVPDSGLAYAIGYSNKSKIPYARPFIKYTPTWPRSFMPATKKDSDRIARMKQIPVTELIKGRKLLFIDDSIVRGTQLRETVDFLYSNGAKEVHMRAACPPVMFACKYLQFTRSTPNNELLARKVIYELEGEEGEKHLEEYANPDTERGKKLRTTIAQKFHFSSLEYQTLDGVKKSIGINPCDLCTYCWDGKED